MTKSMEEPIVLYDRQKGSKKKIEAAFALAESPAVAKLVARSNKEARNNGLRLTSLGKEESKILWKTLSKS